MNQEKEINQLKAQVSMLYKGMNELMGQIDSIVDSKVQAAMKDYRKLCDARATEATAALKQLIDAGEFSQKQFAEDIRHD